MRLVQRLWYYNFHQSLEDKSGKDSQNLNCSTVACSATNCVFAEYQRVGVHRSGSWALVVAVLQLISGHFWGK